MKVHIVKPYSIEKNLGKAYNEAMALIPDGDWACLMDYDTMFLTPDCGQILHKHADFADHNYESNVLFTCLTNRIHPLACDQLYKGKVSEDTNILNHIKIAEELREDEYSTRIYHPISGFLMMVSKSLWEKIKFSEDRKCLGVDNDFSQRVLDNDYYIARMDNLYVWHTYRLKNGIKDKTHLI
jgi:GT2 family glycosyltransferase